VRRSVQVAGITVVLTLAVIAAIPPQVVLTIDPLSGTGAVVSGWLGSSGEAVVSLHEQPVPWETRLSARGLRGFIEAGRDGQVRVRARIVKGPLTLSELNLVGARVSLETEGGVFSGRARR